MPLRINLRPYEQIMINGAVITNLKRRTSIVVHNEAQILQGRYVLKPDSANSPIRRVYFAAQMAYIYAENPEECEQWTRQFHDRIAEVLEIITTADIVRRLVEAGEAVSRRQYYRALRTLLPVIEYEEKMFLMAGNELPPAFTDGINQEALMHDAAEGG